MKIKQVMYKSYSDLEPQEKKFYTLNSEKYELNTCDKCGMIDRSNELFWDCDYDLKGKACLCEFCFKKLKDKPQ
tara:strand:+ start:493 stop:714 length:222 start_codon:yes stop_codon:yes gene_type:complete